MAKPGELAELISNLFGSELPTVRQQARALRDDDLMAKEKGGRGAGTLSARDASHLLIAAAGTTAVSKSSALITRPGGLVSNRSWTVEFVSIPELARLAEGHSFAQALEALLQSAISGTLQIAAEQLEGGSVDLVHDVAPSLNIEVAIHGPVPRASILIEEVVFDEDGRRYRYKDNFERHFYSDRATKPGAGNIAWMDIARPKEMDTDLRTEMTFSHRTIAMVGALLARKGP